MSTSGVLEGLVVAERGGRLATAVAGTLLAELGATVIRLEGRGHDDARADDEAHADDEATAEDAVDAFEAGRPRSDPPDWHRHPLALGGKTRLTAPAGRECAAAWEVLCAAADVALVSAPARATRSKTADGIAAGARVVASGAPLTACLTAFGADAPGAQDAQDPQDPQDEAASELAVQARSGAMATTGVAHGAPCAVRAPLLELLAGINAATSVLAALRAGSRGVLDLALFDSAIALAGTFHPQALANPARRFRNGARHTLCSPWNVYRATDGWVTICIASDDQWQRFARLIGRNDLASSPALATSPQRVEAVDTVDAAVTQFVRELLVDEVAQRLRSIDVPVSAVADPGPEVARAPRAVRAPDGRTFAVPGPLAWLSRTPLCPVAQIDPPQPFAAWQPVRRGGRPVFATPRAASGGAAWGAASDAASDAHAAATRSFVRPPPPLAGIRVIDLGPYTAGPLATRYLADLGAEVIKVETPGGERTRGWQPQVARTSHYFANYNCGKRSVEIDLASAAGAAALRSLLTGADVFVQNLKPGALKKLGVDLDELSAAQPDLVICSISGYGRDAPPVAALDTVAQAGSGLMALVDGPADSSPLKAGFSYGDLTAAHAAVFAIVAALVERDRSGLGQQIDISMHDALVWLVQLGWPGIGGPSFAVVANGEDGVDREGQAGWTLRVERDAPVPVLEVADAVLGEDAQRRQSLRTIAPGERSGMDATAATTATTDGAWRVLASPHRWRVAPSDIGRFVAMAGADNPRLAAIPQRQALEEI